VFSEDPLLTARIGVAYVRGLAAGGVAATVKHFVPNDSETDRFSVDARADAARLAGAVPAHSSRSFASRACGW
jgi:beta-glucosidase